MEASSLYELIQQLQYGTKVHIGVLFFSSFGNEKCQLPLRHTIHSREICDVMKGREKNAFQKCFRCRNLAIQKALTGKQPFGGICINGVYEYTHPVLIRGEVACMIYIGNILDSAQGREKLKKRLQNRQELLETLQPQYSEQRCASVASVIESYIRFLLDKYGERSKSDKPLIENIKNYLQENMEYDITLSHIAAVFHYNRQYLGRLFKKETGASIHEYLLLQRIEHARLLLLQSGQTVTEIANRSGFQNIPYFNRQFKNKYGLPPSQYRKHYKQSSQES